MNFRQNIETILASVAAGNTDVDTALLALTAIDGNVDDIETLANTVDGNVDDIETLANAIDVKADTISDHVDDTLNARDFYTKRVVTTALTNGTADLDWFTVSGGFVDVIDVRYVQNDACTADLTSLAVNAGTAKALPVITALEGIAANIAAKSNQLCGPDVPIALATGEKIICTYVGTGTGALNGTAIVHWRKIDTAGVLAAT